MIAQGGGWLGLSPRSPGCGIERSCHSHTIRSRCIGIDLTHLAITLIKKRLWDSFGEVIDRSSASVREPTAAILSALYEHADVKPTARHQPEFVVVLFSAWHNVAHA